VQHQGEGFLRRRLCHKSICGTLAHRTGAAGVI